MPNVYRRIQWVPGTESTPGYRVIFRSKVPRFLKKAAFTWRRTVRVAGNYYSPMLREHEETHLRQEELEGTLRYTVSYLWQLLTRGYRRISYEIEATVMTDQAALRGTLPRPIEAWVWVPW